MASVDDAAEPDGPLVTFVSPTVFHRDGDEVSFSLTATTGAGKTVVGEFAVHLALAARDQGAGSTVALSGGVFQNARLTAVVVEALEAMTANRTARSISRAYPRRSPGTLGPCGTRKSSRPWAPRRTDRSRRRRPSAPST